MERPCARSVKVETPCVFSQVCVRAGVVWALTEHKALFYREGLSSFCSEGEGWKCDTVRWEGLSHTGESKRDRLSPDGNPASAAARLRVWT